MLRRRRSARPGAKTPASRCANVRCWPQNADGLTNAGIAGKLSISPKTVEGHRAAIMRQLDVKSTPALVVRAVRPGILDP